MSVTSRPEGPCPYCGRSSDKSMIREELSIRFTPVIDAALEGGRKLRLKLDAMKQALREGDEQKALSVARDICGVKHSGASR